MRGVVLLILKGDCKGGLKGKDILLVRTIMTQQREKVPTFTHYLRLNSTKFLVSCVPRKHSEYE